MIYIKSENELYNYLFGNDRGLRSSTVCLFSGQEGAGKSTFMLQLITSLNTNQNIIYFAGEEPRHEYQHKIQTIGENVIITDCQAEGNLYMPGLNLTKIEKEIIRHKPTAIVVDSLQMCYSDNINSGIGKAKQVDNSSMELCRMTREYDLITFIIGHSTKSGQPAGSNFMKHMVDIVSYMHLNPENEDLRCIKTTKNRRGACPRYIELLMTDNGLQNADYVKSDSQDDYSLFIIFYKIIKFFFWLIMAIIVVPFIFIIKRIK